jgi:hypothetical protein
MTSSNYTIADFSPHLFWDVNKDKLDFDINKPQVIQQVLEYGLLSDWLIIKEMYGVQQIGETASTFRQLDPMALSFIVALSGLSKESFTCYATKQLMPPHWNF